MESMIAIAVSSIFSIVIAYLTATFKTRTELQQEKAKRELDITQQQKYNYFLPFKYLADEFCSRLRHITARLSEQGEKHDNMVRRFQLNIDKKDHNWFYNDVVGPHGGYYFISTIYLNLMLFYWIKQIQDNYPYIPLKITDKNLHELKEHNKIAEEQNYVSAMPSECEIHNFIKNIKTLLGGANGIPYGLHDSFGDFMFDYSKGTRINYDDFCKSLIDKSSRTKFTPVIKFWLNIIDKDGKPNKERMTKLVNLANLLEILKKTDIRVI
jgi:hypothetical protein